MNKLSITMAIKLASNLRSDQKERALKGLRRLWQHTYHDSPRIPLKSPGYLKYCTVGKILNFAWGHTNEGYAFWYNIESALCREFGLVNIKPMQDLTS